MGEQKGPCQATTTRRTKLGGFFEGTKRPMPSEDQHEKRMLLCRCFCVVFLFGGLGKGPSQATSRRRTFWEVFRGKQKAPARQGPPGGYSLGSFGAIKRPLPGNGYQEDIFWMYGPMGPWGMSYIAKMVAIYGTLKQRRNPLRKKEIPFCRVRKTR